MTSRTLSVRALVLALAALAPAFAGCLDAIESYHDFVPEKEYVNPGVFVGNYSKAANGGSTVLVPGFLQPGPPELIRLVSERPHTITRAGGSVENGTVLITMAIWRPNTTEGRYPVIIDAGPYYEQGTDNITTRGQSTPFLIKNFLPHGYAVVQLAVRGTGTSGGCMELMGRREAEDLSQAVTWLAQQPWSNGNVAMIGASYDGSTPWMVAALGNPHLKTIVPVSGLPDIFDLMFHNGTSETRGPIMHSAIFPTQDGTQAGVYWNYGFSSAAPWAPVTGGGANGREAYQDRQNLLCDEAIKGAATGYYATLSGERDPDALAYWRERDYRDDVLKNYKGSVFLIHGLQDWNVDPHAAIPFNRQLSAAGIEMKEWYGQWGHAFPDSQCADIVMPLWFPGACRLDYAEVLRRWFDRYLRDNQTIELGPSLQVQDNRGYWRNADTFPPTDAQWKELFLNPTRQLDLKAASTEERRTLMPPGKEMDQEGFDGPVHVLEFVSEPMQEELHISGLPQLHVDFEPQGPGGFLGGWLFDVNEKGDVLDRWRFDQARNQWVPLSRSGTPPVIGHAQMDLRYFAGGEERQTLTPNERERALMEFEPMETRVPAGHRLMLWLFQYPYNDKYAGSSPSPVTVVLGGQQGSVLRLPIVDVSPYDVFPVPGGHFPDPTNYDRPHVAPRRFKDVMEPMEPPGGEKCASAPVKVAAAQAPCSESKRAVAT